MLFNSIFFLFVFFPLSTGIYYLLPHRSRWGWLLLVSCYFYMGFIPEYLLILAFTITIDYFAGLYIEKLAGKNKKYFLILSIISNIGILFFFKYFNFFNANVVQLAQLLHWNYSIESLKLILPIGLSFHTFQSLSYIIEVYRGNQKAERNYGIFALYVMFYPQLVAGPIERPQHMLHQFHEKHFLNFDRFFSGLNLIVWGLFKKVVIADRVSFFVNQIYGNVNNFYGAHLAFATFLFAIQIYCDFSGYSDMARGLARTLGFELMVNFNAPYFSRSISEFWRRWHISLSSWFKDYVYISLGGSRVVKWRWQLNLLITFLLSGLWHGANWTFIIWGGLNGLYLALSIAMEKLRDQTTKIVKLNNLPLIKAWLQTSFVFLLILFSWIFFRSTDLKQAGVITSKIFSTNWQFAKLLEYYYQQKAGLMISLFAIGVLFAVDYLHSNQIFKNRLKSNYINLKYFAIPVLLLTILLLGKFTNDQFIYFQF